MGNQTKFLLICEIWRVLGKKSNKRRLVYGLPLGVQGLRICMPMQETRRWPTVWKLRSSVPHAPQLLSLWSRAWELQLLKPTCPRAQAPEQEKPLQWEAHVPQLEKTQMQQQRAHALQQRPRIATNKYSMLILTYFLPMLKFLEVRGDFFGSSSLTVVVD